MLNFFLGLVAGIILAFSFVELRNTPDEHEELMGESKGDDDA